MKTLIYVLIALLVLPCVVLAQQKEKPLSLADSRAGGFFESKLDVVSPVNSMAKKGGAYSFKWKEGFFEVRLQAKKGRPLDLSMYNSVSVNIRFKKPRPEIDTVQFFIHLIQWEGSMKCWTIDIPCPNIPSDNRWYNVVIPLSLFSTAPQNGALEKHKIIQLGIGMFNPAELEAEACSFEVKNFFAWVQSPAEITVTPLE